MRISILLTALLLSSQAAASSDEIYVSLTTGNHVFQICAPGSSKVRQNSCAWYVKGVIEAVQVHAQPSQAGYSLLCMPDDLPGDQLTGIFGKYLHDHPEQRHEPAMSLVITAMSSAFRCP